MKDEKLLEEYSHLLDSIAWYNKGDVIELAKLAKKLGRDYMQDLAERKSALADIATRNGVEKVSSRVRFILKRGRLA